MEVERKPFKAVELLQDSGSIRVEEGFEVRLVTQGSGEVFEGTVEKLEAKKMTIKVESEIGERNFSYAEDIAKIEILAK